MGYFELELESSPGISKDYFRSRAESILAEISNVNFEDIDFEIALSYSLVYAEARELNAAMKQDLARSDGTNVYWMLEEQRWHVAALHAQYGNPTLLCRQLRIEADKYFQKQQVSSEVAIYGMVLSNLSEILSP